MRCGRWRRRWGARCRGRTATEFGGSGGRQSSGQTKQPPAVDLGRPPAAGRCRRSGPPSPFQRRIQLCNRRAGKSPAPPQAARCPQVGAARQVGVARREGSPPHPPIGVSRCPARPAQRGSHGPEGAVQIAAVHGEPRPPAGRRGGTRGHNRGACPARCVSRRLPREGPPSAARAAACGRRPPRRRDRSARRHRAAGSRGPGRRRPGPAPHRRPAGRPSSPPP